MVHGTDLWYIYFFSFQSIQVPIFQSTFSLFGLDGFVLLCCAVLRCGLLCSTLPDGLHYLSMRLRCHTFSQNLQLNLYNVCIYRTTIPYIIIDWSANSSIVRVETMASNSRAFWMSKWFTLKYCLLKISSTLFGHLRKRNTWYVSK